MNIIMNNRVAEKLFNGFKPGVDRFRDTPTGSRSTCSLLLLQSFGNLERRSGVETRNRDGQCARHSLGAPSSALMRQRLKVPAARGISPTTMRMIPVLVPRCVRPHPMRTTPATTRTRRPSGLFMNCVNPDRPNDSAVLVRTSEALG